MHGSPPLLCPLTLSRVPCLQAEAVPRALEGKDVVARARTGSGKTLAYLLPAINRLLQGGSQSAWQVLVLVPTRELSEQVREEAALLLRYCGEGLTATALTSSGNKANQRASLATAGQLVGSAGVRIASSSLP